MTKLKCTPHPGMNRLAQIIAAIFVLVASVDLRAQDTYYWDANGADPGIGGTGTWDTTSDTWRVDSATGILGTYGNAIGDHAVFDTDTSSGRTVTLNSSSIDLNVNTISFQYTGWPSPQTGYTIAGPASGTAKLVLGGTTPTIQVQNWPVFSTISAPIAGNSSLTVITGSHNVSTLTLSGANTFTGPVHIPDGTLRMSSLNYVDSGDWSGHLTGSSLGIPSTVAEGTIHLGSGTTGGTLYRTGTAPETTDRVIDLAGTTGGARIDNSGANQSLKFTSDFTASGSGDKTLTLYTTSGAIELAGAIVDSAGGATTVAAAGTTAITLSGLSTYSGQTIITNGGGLRVNSIRNLGEASAMGAPTTVENGTIELGVGTNTRTLNYFGTGDITDRVIDLSGTTGGATINMGGSSGTLRFTNDFTATGLGAKTLSVTRFNGTGTLDIAGKIVDSAGGATSLSVTDWTSNALHIFSGDSTFTGKTTLGAGARVSINSIRNLGMSSALGAPTTVADGTISMGSGGFSSALTYTGTGDITNRTINLASTTGAITLTQSGTGLLKFTSDFTATGAGSKTLTLGGSTSGGGEIAGAIVDNSGTNTTRLTKAGSGIWTLSGANTYTGATTVNGGILTFANTAAQSPGTAATVAAAGSVGLGVGGAGYFSSADVDALFANNLAGVSMATASGVAIDTGAGDFTYATNQSAARALTKLGANTLALTGVNTYSGATRVLDGTLEVAATGAINGTSGITIANGSTLLYNSLNPLTRPVTILNGTIGGTGAILTPVTIGANAIVSPGNSPGSQSYTSMTWAPGGTYLWEINDTSGIAGGDPGWDLLVVDTLTLSGLSSSDRFIIDIAELAGVGSAPARGSALGWNIVDYGALSGGFDPEWFALNAAGFSDPAWSTVLWSVIDTGDQLRLQAFQIPEPSSLLLLALAGLAALRRRRRA